MYMLITNDSSLLIKAELQHFISPVLLLYTLESNMQWLRGQAETLMRLQIAISDHYVSGHPTSGQASVWIPLCASTFMSSHHIPSSSPPLSYLCEHCASSVHSCSMIAPPQEGCPCFFSIGYRNCDTHTPIPIHPPDVGLTLTVHSLFLL